MLEQTQMTAMVTALQAGDQNAAASLYDHFQKDTYFFIKSMVTDPELAADLTQDTFLTVLEKVNTLREPAAFPGWLRQIAYNKAANHFRKTKDLTVDETEDGFSVFDTLEEERAEFIPDAALDQEDFKATILSMLLELPETQRSALVLHYYEDYSVKQIAQIQGVSEGTVKSRLNYGRNAIRGCVEDYEKKTGVKLHSTAVLPLLLWLFAQGVLVRDTTVAAGGMSASASAASAGGSSASASGVSKAVATGAKVAAAGAKKGLVAALIAAGAALAVVVGIVVAVILPGLSQGTEDLPEDPDTGIVDTQDKPDDETHTEKPTGNYAPAELWVDMTEKITYVKNKQIFYQSPEGPVQLTQAGFQMTEDAFAQLGEWQIPGPIRFSRDMRYVYYPDGIVVDGESYNGISFELYFRDLADSEAEPVKIGDNITDFDISADGLRICFYDLPEYAYCVYEMDSSGIVARQQVFTYSQEQYGAEPELWNEDLTVFVYRFFEETRETVYVWNNGNSIFLGENVELRFAFAETDPYPDVFYYWDVAGNVYRFDMTTLESTYLLSGIERIEYVDEDGGFYYIANGTMLSTRELIEQMVIFDEGEFDPRDMELGNYYYDWYHMYDHYYYRDGQSTCLATQANSMEEIGDITITGKVYPDQVEKVKASEYGKELYDELFRRLNTTFRYTLQSESDTMELSLNEVLEAGFLSHVYFNQREGDSSLMCIARVRVSIDSDEEVWYQYSIPVNGGQFGEVTLTQTDDPGNDPSQQLFYAQHGEDGTYELYMWGELVAEGLYGNICQIYDEALICTKFDSATGRGTYCVIDETGSQEILTEEKCLIGLSYCAEGWLYLASEDPEAMVGDLYLYRDGDSVLVDTGVTLYAAPQGICEDVFPGFHN